MQQGHQQPLPFKGQIPQIVKQQLIRPYTKNVVWGTKAHDI
jgi:hypothetical protein